MKVALLIGLVVVIHHASGFRLGCGGCGSSCGIGSSCGCGSGFPYANNRGCPGADLVRATNDWCNPTNCVPLVVRPRDLPKPVVSPVVEADLNTLVAGPCSIKKAIVKPAVLPKPVCQPRPAGCFHSCHSSQSHGCHSSCTSSCVNGVFGGGCAGACGGYAGACGGSFLPNGAVVGANGVVLSNANPYGVNSPFAPNGQFAPGAAHPADAVSIDLAYKLAQQDNSLKKLSEDRLNFGFRKIPKELPVKAVIKNNVPEEKIFSLNGQIVELKPVRENTQNAATLEEEAAELLQQLQEEEEEALANEGAGISYGPRRPTLGEVGFGAAKLSKPNLVEIPASAAEVASSVVDSCEVRDLARDINTNCGCGRQVGFNGACGCGCGCGVSSACSCDKKACKVIPGNVEYKTLPKPQSICLTPPQVPDSCESPEIEISQEDTKIHCSCIPVCVKKSCNSHCKKSCVTFEKY